MFPGSPLAATKEELEKIAGFWPDIEKSRAEARRLLKEAGAEDLTLRVAQPQRRPAVQVRRHLGDRRMEQDRRHGTQKVRADRPVVRGDAQRRFRRGGRGQLPQHRQSVLDTQKYLPHDGLRRELWRLRATRTEIDIYDKMLHETDFAEAARADARVREARLDTEAHEFPMLWWYRDRAVRGPTCKGWKIRPSHYVNQDLADSGSTSAHNRSRAAGEVEAAHAGTASMYRYIVKRVLPGRSPRCSGRRRWCSLLMRLIPGDICVVRLGSGGGTVRSQRASPPATPRSASTGR